MDSMETPESREKTPNPLPTTPLETARLHLRPWGEADIPGIFTICQDPEIQRWTTVPTPYRYKDAEWFVREFVPAGFAQGDEATFGMFVKETGEIAGSVALMGLTRAKDVRTAEIGFWAAPDARGRGYMTEAVREMIRWGFDELGVQRMVWQAYDGNVASRRVAEKAGLKIVGLQRGSHTAHGKRIDMWLADMVDSDPR